MRSVIHRTICWYLRKCWGAFHCYPYGVGGRYVVLMNERQYHDYMHMANALSIDTSNQGGKR